jgi:hypothetical protein
MTLDGLEKTIKALKDSGVPGKTTVVVCVEEEGYRAGLDIMALREEEITYSTVLEGFKINTSGIPNPNAKRSVVIY